MNKIDPKNVLFVVGSKEDPIQGYQVWNACRHVWVASASGGPQKLVYGYAGCQDRKSGGWYRVLPGEQAEGVLHNVLPGQAASPMKISWKNRTIVLVTLGVSGLWNAYERPADVYLNHDFDAPPEDFLAASLVGQNLALFARQGWIKPAKTFEDLQIGAPPTIGTFFYLDTPRQHEGWYLVCTAGAHKVPLATVGGAALAHCPVEFFSGKVRGFRKEPKEILRDWWYIQQDIDTPQEKLKEDQTQRLMQQAAQAIRDAPDAADVDPRGWVKDLTHLPPQPLTAFGAVCRRMNLGILRKIRISGTEVGLLLEGCGAGSGPGEEPVRQWLAGAGFNLGCARDSIHGYPRQGTAWGILQR